MNHLRQNNLVLLRKMQMKLCDAKRKQFHDHAENISLKKILKMLKFSIKYFFSKCAQIYLSADWLTSSENILDKKLDGKYYFLRRVGWSFLWSYRLQKQIIATFVLVFEVYLSHFATLLKNEILFNEYYGNFDLNLTF